MLAVLVLLAAGCSSRDGSGAGSEASTQAAAGEIGEDSNASAEQAPEGNGTGGTASGEAGSGILQAADPNRKLVKTQTAEMETTEFDAFTAWVQENIRKAGGYIENASVSGKETGGTAFRHASYVLRIPETGLDTFMEELKTEGNVLYYTESVEDITLNYTDTESHIAALEQEQEALMDMLSQSGDLDTLLAIQSRLTEAGKLRIPAADL